MSASLANGMVLDDYFHRQVALEQLGYLGEPRHPLDMFTFLPSREALADLGMETGLWPWWASAVQVRFFRPLTAATHWLDHTAWPDAVWLMHAHSLVWYGLLVLAAAALFRRTLGAGWVAGLAALLYALDDGHATPVGWLASRNMITATAFGVISLWAYHRWCIEHWRPGRWASPLSLVAALLAAELAIGSVGYLVAHAAVVQTGSRRARALSLAPHAIVCAAWQLGYGWMGYGASSTGLYTHPLTSPGAFAFDTLERWPVLVVSQLGLPIADPWTMFPLAWGPAVALGSFALVLLFLRVVWVVVRGDRAARFYTLGAGLAAIPVCSSFCHSRLLFFVGLGGAALFAKLVERASLGPRSRSLAIVAALVLARQLVVGAASLPPRALSPQLFQALMVRADSTLPNDAALADQTLVVVNGPHVFLSNFLQVFRHVAHRGTSPHRIRTLGATTERIVVTRTDARTLELYVEDGYLQGRVEQIAWQRSDRRDPGYRVEQGDETFEVLESTPDGRHRRVRVRFADTLEIDLFRWVAWVGNGYATFVPPAPGTSVELAPIDMIEVMGSL